MKPFDGSHILITGGTGSIGHAIVRRIFSDIAIMGEPSCVTVFSRDEAKQHEMRLAFTKHEIEGTYFRNFEQKLQFFIGDIRNPDSIGSALTRADIVINAAALKQVPACEYFPYEAVRTNISGAENIVRTIEKYKLPVKTVIGISTDKACKPVNVMGMSKGIQERIFLNANLSIPTTKFACVRYGNVLASRGSILPLFTEQIRRGGPITITDINMTRFLVTFNRAVDTIFAAIIDALPGEIYVPKVPAGKIIDIARILVGNANTPINITGIRPGEKLHEILVSEEESMRTISRGDWYVIQPILPELQKTSIQNDKSTREYSSADCLIQPEDLHKLISEALS